MAQLKYKLNGEWVPLNLGGAGSGEQYELPVATQNTLGGVSIGEGIDITPEGKISVKTPSSPAESVLYTAQELTEEQKAQARQNIGAQNLYNGLTPVSYSCTDGTYSVSDTVYLESGNIISPVDTVSNDVRIAFRFINSWSRATQLDYWKNDIKKYKLLIDNGYLENNTIWYSKPDKKFKKQIRFGTNSTLGNYIIFNFNYNYEVIGQLVYYVDTDTISTGTDTYLNYKLSRDKNNVLSYSAIKLSSDPTEPMQIATKQYVDNAIANISATDLSNCVQTNKENILGDNGSIISNSSRGNSLTISNGVIEQKNSNQNTISLGDAKVVFSYDSDGSSSTKGNGTFAMYGKKGEEYFKFKATNGDVKVSGIATPTLQNDAVNKSYVDLQIANIEIPTVPTNVSAFTNDAGYLTEHQSLADYALKSEIPSPYSLPTASATELGGVKADSAEATDTQPVRIGVDGKLYTTGEEDFELIFMDTVTEDVYEFNRNVDKDGNPFELKEAVVIVYTVPFETAKNELGRGVGFLPSARWGHDTPASISNSIPAGTSSIARYDVLHIKVVQGYQCLIDRWGSQNSTNVRGIMMKTNIAGQVPINFKYGDDVTAIGELSNSQGNLTCVKIVSYGACMAKGDVVILYGKRV